MTGNILQIPFIPLTTKSPRSDEHRAITSLIEYLENTQGSTIMRSTYEPNGTSTAPDWLLTLGAGSVLVEIKNSGDGFITLPNNTYDERNSYESSSTNTFLKKIITLTQEWIDPSETIIVTFTSLIPLGNHGKLAKKIARELENLYKNKMLSHDRNIKIKIITSDTQLPILHIEAKLTNYYAGKGEYSAVKSILSASLFTPDPIGQNNLASQAEYILYYAIKKKAKKLAHLQQEKWLVLINTHPLLNIELYSIAFGEIRKRLLSNLTKIFIVFQSSAIELPPV